LSKYLTHAKSDTNNESEEPMIDESQLENLKERLESIERLLENFIYRDAKLALKNALDDPNTAASKAGIAIEGLLGIVYRKIAEEKGEKISEKPLAIEELKAGIGKIGGEIPRTILRNIDLIQQYRNEGSHSRVETVKSGELGSVLSALLNVLVWYLEDVRKEKLDFSEIGLKNKEKQYIDFVTMALSDGVISNSEREFLNSKIRELGLSLEKAKFIEEEILQKFGKLVSSPEVQVQNPSLHSEDTTLNRREARVLEDCQEQIFHENKSQVALKELQPLVQKYPKNKEVSELYTICLRDKDLNSALQYLKGISKKSHLEYRLFVEVLGELGEFNSAFDELEEMGKLFPGESELVQMLEAHLNILEYRVTNRKKLLDLAQNLNQSNSSSKGYFGYVNAIVKLASGTLKLEDIQIDLEPYYNKFISNEINKINLSKIDKNKKLESLPLTFTNSLGMEFVLIPAGIFMMGALPKDEEADEIEKPIHKVSITKSFYIGKYLVTQDDWVKLNMKNTSKFKELGKKLPVECVTYFDCMEFLQKLNQMESKNYRLPTEAEWEYAARGGLKIIYTYGDNVNELKDYAWYNENSEEKTHPVGLKKPNISGLHDMTGNVFEWCEDWYDDDYYKTKCEIDPKGPESGEFKVIRGGSWNYNSSACRVSDRGHDPPNYGDEGNGFRIVFNP
jgi:formylglycine-generating enzyme required for sulfatase activity